MNNSRSLLNGTATFMDINECKYEGKFVEGYVAANSFPMRSIKSLSKKKSRVGLERFIPNLIVDYVDIEVNSYWERFGYLKKTYTNGQIFTGSFKTNTEGIGYSFERFGYSLMTIPNNFDWSEGETKWDKFIGVY
ncbi:MAG: Uncharacterised protein [Polaribacter sejongensis]|nr:MAG: Uncharacterised protein [Polaribacter sejongensis]